MNGEDVRAMLKERRIFQWELAAQLQISEFTLCRWCRGPIGEERAKAIQGGHQAIGAPWRALRGAGMMCCATKETHTIFALGNKSIKWC